MSRVPFIHDHFPLLFLACVLLTGMAVGPGVERAARRIQAGTSIGKSEEAMISRNTNAFAAMLGEVRATAADLLFIKTSVYMHAGVGYRPKIRDKNDPAHPDDEMACEQQGAETMIRSTATDFRGFLGDLERQVKPYRDAKFSHVHVSENEMVPWFRIITLTNPRFIRAYRLGASVLLHSHKWQEALDFLNEGIARNQDNPELFLIYQSLAQMHMKGKFDETCPWRKDWAALCVAAAGRSYDLALLERPPGGISGKRKNNLVWNDDMEEDFLFSAHSLVLALDQMGRRAEALQVARGMLRHDPGLAVIQHTVRRLESGK